VTSPPPPSQEGTRLDVNPFAEPVPSGPIMREPTPTPPQRPAASPGGSRVRSIVLTVLAIVAAALVGILVASLISGGNSDNGAAPASSSTTTSSSEEPPPPSEPTPEDYEAAVRDYYGQLPDDIDAAWAMMTSNAQEKSGGVRSYKRFWNSVRSVDVVSTTASGADVEATLEFVTKRNRSSTEEYRLTLVEQDDELLIDNFKKLGKASEEDDDS
jgi:hypothetical protein